MTCEVDRADVSGWRVKSMGMGPDGGLVKRLRGGQKSGMKKKNLHVISGHYGEAAMRYEGGGNEEC